jgi:hypothetical protein
MAGGLLHQLDLVIDDPVLQNFSRTTEFEPKFEIMNGEKHFWCDPSIAVDKARLVFDGFSHGRELGFCLISVPDPEDLIESIVQFLHGNVMRITSKTAETFSKLGNALGIPVISKYAQQLLKAQPDS